MPLPLPLLPLPPRPAHCCRAVAAAAAAAAAAAVTGTTTLPSSCYLGQYGFGVIKCLLTMEYGLGFVWVIADMLAIDTNCINNLRSDPLPDEVPINYTITIGNSDALEDRVVGDLGYLFGSPSIEWTGSEVR